MSGVENVPPTKRPPYGLRGWVVLLWGAIWTTWGVTLFSFNDERAGAALYDVVTRFASLSTWGIIWIVIGVSGAAAGVLRRHSLGFFLLMLMPWGWGVGLLFSHWTADSPSGIPLGLTFIALGTSIALTSGMEDARLLPRRKVAA